MLTWPEQNCRNQYKWIGSPLNSKFQLLILSRSVWQVHMCSKKPKLSSHYAKISDIQLQHMSTKNSPNNAYSPNQIKYSPSRGLACPAKNMWGTQPRPYSLPSPVGRMASRRERLELPRSGNQGPDSLQRGPLCCVLLLILWLHS